VPEAKGTQDFLGVNYYSRDYVAFNLLKAGELFGRRFYRPGAELSTTGFLANEPLGMFEALKWGLKFNIPMLVTENGVEDADDHLRPRYLVEHVHQIWRAVNFNWPIKGYYHWSLVDNFEWERGWTQRFGLWELDIETQARHKRPSADLYAEICRENGLSADMVARYAPAVFPEMFPN
jgi:beta-glucosidase